MIDLLTFFGFYLLYLRRALLVARVALLSSRTNPFCSFLRLVICLPQEMTNLDPETAALIEATRGPDPEEAKKQRVNSFSNKFHRYLDYSVGSMIYFLGSAMHFRQQSNAMTTIGLWASGSYLFINSGMRSVEGPSSQIAQGEAASCWLWMLSSFHQYKLHGTMKFCGMSAYLSLMAASYYTFQWASSVFGDE